MLKTYSRSTKPREFPGELPVEYESACRLCLEKEDVMINIFGDKDMIPIVLKIRTCITIDVTEDDKLPNYVCQNCLTQLDSFYTFKKRCLATNVKLKQFVALPPSQATSSENRVVKDYLDLTLSEDGNEDDIKNACTLTWEEKQGLHTPIFEFPASLINNEGLLPVKSEPVKKPLPCTQVPVKPEYLKNSVNSAGYVSEDSMEDFAGFDEQSESKLQLSKIKQQIINTEQQQSFPIKRRRGRPKKITNPLQCRVCYKVMQSEKEVSNHMIEHAPRVKSCPVCQKSFNNISMLQRHLRVHTGERPFACDVCGRAFSQKEILLRHKVLHSGQRPYSCDLCDKQYSQPEALKKHIQLHHCETPVQMRYQCERCNKKFHHASGLSRHQLRHTGVMFSCTICNKVFTDSSSVKRHVRVHPKARKGDNSIPYEIIKMELGEHSYSLASKTEDSDSSAKTDNSTSKSNTCTKCCKVFNSENKLKIHNINVHKEKKSRKYQCDHCGKTFRFATGLGRHQLIHRVLKKEKEEEQFIENMERTDNVDKKDAVKVRQLQDIKKRNEEITENSLKKSSTKESDTEKTNDGLIKENRHEKLVSNKAIVQSEMGSSKELCLEETKVDSDKLINGETLNNSSVSSTEEELCFKETNTISGEAVNNSEISSSKEELSFKETMDFPEKSVSGEAVDMEINSSKGESCFEKAMDVSEKLVSVETTNNSEVSSNKGESCFEKTIDVSEKLISVETTSNLEISCNKGESCFEKTMDVSEKSICVETINDKEISCNKRETCFEEAMDVLETSVSGEATSDTEINSSKGESCFGETQDVSKISINNEAITNSGVSSMKEQSCFEESMDDSEDVSITVEPKHEDTVGNSVITVEKSNIVEAMDDSVEITIVPKESTVNENQFKEKSVFSEKLENKELLDNVPKGSDMSQPDSVKSDIKENIIEQREEGGHDDVVSKSEISSARSAREDLEREIFGYP